MSDPTNIYLNDLRQEIEKELEYGDSLSEWVREACRLRLELNNSEESEIIADGDGRR